MNADDEMLSKKRYMRRYKRNVSNITRLQYKLAELDARIKTVSAQKLDGLPGGGVPVTKEDLICDKMELEERIVRLKARGRTIRRELLDCVDSVDDPLCAEILELFFVDGLTHEEIAEKNGYSVRYVTKLYTKGLQDIDIGLITA